MVSHLFTYSQSLKLFVGMYQQEDDPYGEEGEGEEDRNDGLNALVTYFILLLIFRISNGSLDSIKKLTKESTI